ncbi:glycosyl hydrolase [Amycolatopsis balhimycina]|uniref:glycosyl hydrolase n=1 Tax=Amycolatopsis balhimycina TaxID=208443 RepID=UPI00035E83BA|nr:glycosyl hydrolase [Amycolatopsis balhimycina]
MQPRTHRWFAPPAALLAALAALLAALAAVVFAVRSTPARGDDGPPVSPLLWGENLTLDPNSLNSDWFLTQPALRAGLAAAHTSVIRMPVRGPSPDQAGIANRAEFQLAARQVRELGLTPLVILRNPQDPDLLADDTEVVRYVNSVFGNQPVYYEWANETDLPGSPGQVGAADYVASWNHTVPALKAAANPGARFLGPAGYQLNTADLSYLKTFLAGANPRPDAVSWHEYTCNDATKTEDQCLAALGSWPKHLTAARNLMTDTIGQQLPIWVTEWNYTPDIVHGDGKHADADFLRRWTTTALQTLAANGVTASMHFDVRNQQQDHLPLVEGDGTLAPEGIAFKAAYDALAGTPPTTTTTTSVPAPGPKYSFEDAGLDGWAGTGHVSALAGSTDVGGEDGTHALRVTFTSNSAADQPYVHVNPPGGGPGAGRPLTAHFYVPGTTTATVTAKLYVQDLSGTWHIGADTVLSQRGSWTELSYTPSGYSGNAQQIGVQLRESPVGTAATVYLDAVGW